MVVAVTTTGTSLLTNAVNYVFRHPEKGEKMKYIKSILEKIRESSRRMDRAALEFVENKGKELKSNKKELEKFEKKLKNDLLNYLNEVDEKTASAELNTLRTIEEKGKEDIQFMEGKTHVIFLHSDTLTGRICAKALSEYLEKLKVSNHLMETPGLGFQPEHFMYDGLNSLVNNLTKIVREYKQKGQFGEAREVIFCATGGFKAELAITNLVGLLFGVKVYYLHELFKDTVIIPPLPLKVDPEFWEQNKEFLRWITKNPRTKEEIEDKFGRPPRELILLLEERDKLYYISPVGKLIVNYFESETGRDDEYTEEFIIKTVGTHRPAPSISSKPINSLKNIKDNNAKQIFERIKELGVKEVILGEFHPVKTNETFLKVESVKNNTLNCTLYCKKFAQRLVIITPNNTKAKHVRKMLGEKAYP